MPKRSISHNTVKKQESDLDRKKTNSNEPGASKVIADSTSRDRADSLSAFKRYDKNADGNCKGFASPMMSPGLTSTGVFGNNYAGLNPFASLSAFNNP